MGRKPSFTADQRQYISNRVAEKATDEDIAGELGCTVDQVYGAHAQLPDPNPEHVFDSDSLSYKGGPEDEGDTPEDEGDIPENPGDTQGDTPDGAEGHGAQGGGLPISPGSVKPAKQKSSKQRKKSQAPGPGPSPPRTHPNAILDTAESAGKIIGMAGELAKGQSITAEKIMEIRDDAEERARERVGSQAENNGVEQSTLIGFIKDDREYERARFAKERADAEARHKVELEKHKADLDATLARENNFLTTIQGIYKEKDTEIAKIREKGFTERKEYLDKKEALIATQAEAVTAKAQAELASAKEVSKARLDFTERHIGLLNEHAKTVRDMAKDQGETELEKLAALAIERIGEPIVRAVTHKEGQSQERALAPAAPSQPTSLEGQSKGEGTVGLFSGIGKGITKKLIEQYSEQLISVGDKLAYYIEHWPKLPIGLAVDMLWSWRSDPNIGHYVQTAIAWLMGSELKEVVEVVGSSFTEAAKQACSTKKAAEWWAMFQRQIVERYEDEERQAAFFRKEQEEEAAKAQGSAAEQQG